MHQDVEHMKSNIVQIIALANLLPVESDVDELDSFMYQTVGHQVVESYAACTGLPLFRKRICGSSLHAVRQSILSASAFDSPSYQAIR